MKKLVIALLAGIALTASAQNFEGTITWKMTAEITDPAMKQQMAQAQSAMADPAIQAQMQAAMNDPQMKALMESNPQMKSMIQGRMGAMGGMGRGGDPMSNMLPKGMTLKTKGGSTLFLVEGGMAPSETLTMASKPDSVSLDRVNRTYTTLAMPTAAAPAAKTAAPAYSITKTTETATILGYKAQKYLVKATSGADQGASYNIWTTTEIKADAKSMARMQVSQGGQSSFMNEIEGVPLKMEITTPQMKMVMEASVVKKESLPDDLFKIPAGFTEKKR